MGQLEKLLEKLWENPALTDKQKQTDRDAATRLAPVYRALPFDTKVDMYERAQHTEVIVILAGPERESIEAAVEELELDAARAEVDMREYHNKLMGFTDSYGDY
jgi:HSP20 family molecular chaperone IbpA